MLSIIIIILTENVIVEILLFVVWFLKIQYLRPTQEMGLGSLWKKINMYMYVCFLQLRGWSIELPYGHFFINGNNLFITLLTITQLLVLKNFLKFLHILKIMSSKTSNQSNTYHQGQRRIIVNLLAVPVDSKEFRSSFTLKNR